MKTNLLLLMVAALCLTVTSCKNTVSEDIADPIGGESDGTTKVVTLNFNEEQVSMSQTPMTRGENDAKRYYAINVYSQVDGAYQKYAYGVFNTTAGMSLLLEEGTNYRMDCLEIKEDADTVYHDGEKFYHPFMINKRPSPLTNKFIGSTSTNIDDILNGLVNLTKEDSTRYPRVYTYYGTLEDFDPATSSTASIDLRRAVFGLHFVITPPKDGTATINFLNDKNITVSAGDDTYDSEDIYSFHTIKSAIVDGYGGNTKLKVKWTYSNGTTKQEDVYIPITRNNITTIEMGFSGASPTGISINEDDDELGNTTVTCVIGKNK